MRSVSLEKISNVRDLGGIPVAGGRVVKSNLLLRGSALYGASDSDIATLKDDLGIRRVIDLRIGYERDAKPDVTIEGVANLHIPYYDNEIVGYEYFKPIPGTITIGNDFACDPDDFYRDMANTLTTQQMGKALHVIFDSALAGEPVYFHCSGGKDRAGITSLLILEILGCAPEDVLEDYLMTNVSRDAEVDKVYQRFLKLCQGDEDFARRVTDNHCARPENLIAFRNAVDENYGCMGSFIRDVLGFSDEERLQLREQLTVEA